MLDSNDSYNAFWRAAWPVVSLIALVSLAAGIAIGTAI